MPFRYNRSILLSYEQKRKILDLPVFFQFQYSQPISYLTGRFLVDETKLRRYLVRTHLTTGDNHLIYKHF